MTTIKFSDLPPLRDQLDGGTFAGLITLADGRHCAVVLLKERPEKRLTWEKAMGWARSVGGQLVSPAIALLLHANCPDLLPLDLIWTDKPEGASCAWYCYLVNVVDFADIDTEGGSVAVRLIAVEA